MSSSTVLHQRGTLNYPPLPKGNRWKTPESAVNCQRLAQADGHYPLLRKRKPPASPDTSTFARGPLTKSEGAATRCPAPESVSHLFLAPSLLGYSEIQIRAKRVPTPASRFVRSQLQQGREGPRSQENRNSEVKGARTHLRPTQSPVRTKSRKRSQAPEVTLPRSSIERPQVYKPSAEQIDASWSLAAQAGSWRACTTLHPLKMGMAMSLLWLMNCESIRHASLPVLRSTQN
nr:uncharacterized protein LOC123567067 [Macaca fascicularis]